MTAAFPEYDPAGLFVAILRNTIEMYYIRNGYLLELKCAHLPSEITCTKLSGNTPIFPLNSPFHQPLSGNSLLNIVMISPSFNSSSSSFAGLYEYITLHCSRTELCVDVSTTIGRLQNIYIEHRTERSDGIKTNMEQNEKKKEFNITESN